jgi:hypothetical protein
MDLHPFVLPGDWPWGGATASLRLYSNRDWQDINGAYHLGGQERSQDYYDIFPAIVAGRSLLFNEGMNTPATLTSPDRPNVRITGLLFDEDGRYRRPAFRNWVFTDELNPSTFAELVIFNRRKRKCLSDHYLTDVMIYAAIQEAIDGIVLTNMPTARGLTAMVAGVAVVAEPLTTLFSEIHPTMQVGGRNFGALSIGAVDPGVGFTIISQDGGDEGNVGWVMYEP